MREKLKQYIEQLFINAPKTQSAQELKEEMLQNLMDKYDDLLREGKSEEEAYQAAVAGIGDVSDLIGAAEPRRIQETGASAQTLPQGPKQKNPLLLAAAITLYVLCVIPNFLFGNVFGVVLMFAMIATASAILIMNRTVVHPARAALVGVGVALLIVSPVPVILIHSVLGIVLLFVLLGAGVGLIVYGRTAQFNATQQDATDNSSDAANTALPRASKIGYAALAAMVLLCLVGAALSASIWQKQITVHGVNGEIIGGADGATEIMLGDDFGERVEDAIDEKIDDNLGDNIEDAVEGAFTKPGKGAGHDHWDDEEDDDDDDDRPKAQKNSAASAAVMQGAAEVSAAGITEIEIDWVGGDVNISNHGGDTIAISETSSRPLTEKQKLRYTVKGNKLSISYCEDTLFVWDWLDIDRLSMPAKTLTLQLPAGPLPELEINAVSAEVCVQGPDFDELDIESVSGDVQVADVSGRKLNVQTTSGKCSVSGADVTKLNLETTSGAIEVLASRADEVEMENVSGRTEIALVVAPRKLEAETVSGSATLTLPKDATDFTVLVETVNGDFNCGFASVQQNGRYIVGSGAYPYEFTSVSGNFRIISA